MGPTMQDTTRGAAAHRLHLVMCLGTSLYKKIKLDLPVVSLVCQRRLLPPATHIAASPPPILVDNDKESRGVLLIRDREPLTDHKACSKNGRSLAGKAIYISRVCATARTS